jgi:hypothetical protein
METNKCVRYLIVIGDFSKLWTSLYGHFGLKNRIDTILFPPNIKDMEISGGISHKASQQRDWWRSAVICQVYPRSFADGMESLRRSVAS